MVRWLLKMEHVHHFDAYLQWVMQEKFRETKRRAKEEEEDENLDWDQAQVCHSAHAIFHLAHDD